MKRQLLSTVRTIADRTSYLAAWKKLREAVTVRGGHAWIFTAADDPSRFIEFIEWKQDGGGTRLIDESAVRDARTELDRYGPGLEEQWKELDDT